MVATVDVTRCELCGIPTQTLVDGEHGPARFMFTAHTTDFCRKATLARMRAMQEIVTEHVMREAGYRESIEQLSRWVGHMSRICETGSRWLATIPIGGQVPALESDLANALQQTISQVEIQKKRIT